MTTTLEAPVEPTRIERAEDVPEEVRKEIVELRAAGSTLAELKGKFPALTPDALRGVLPPMNKREATARAKPKTAGEAAKSAKPVGGKATAEKQSNAEAAPKPRWIEDADLSARVLAARQLVGRDKLAELLGISASATWRAERDRVTADEAGPLRQVLAQVEERIAKGEFVKPERTPKGAGPTKAEALHRLEVIAQLVRDAREAKTLAAARGYLDEIGKVIEPASE